MKLLILILANLLSVLAVDQIYSVWTKVPDNDDSLDVPSGQPRTNKELERLINNYGTDVTKSVAKSLGDNGHTWYWIVTLPDVKAQELAGFTMVSVYEDRSEPC